MRTRRSTVTWPAEVLAVDAGERRTRRSTAGRSSSPGPSSDMNDRARWPVRPPPTCPPGTGRARRSGSRPPAPVLRKLIVSSPASTSTVEACSPAAVIVAVRLGQLARLAGVHRDGLWPCPCSCALRGRGSSSPSSSSVSGLSSASPVECAQHEVPALAHQEGGRGLSRRAGSRSGRPAPWASVGERARPRSRRGRTEQEVSLLGVAHLDQAPPRGRPCPRW